MMSGFSVTLSSITDRKLRIFKKPSLKKDVLETPRLLQVMIEDREDKLLFPSTLAEEEFEETAVLILALHDQNGNGFLEAGEFLGRTSQ